MCLRLNLPRDDSPEVKYIHQTQQTHRTFFSECLNILSEIVFKI